MVQSRKTVRRFTTRDSAGHPLAPLGRLLLWCPAPQTQAKIVAQLHSEDIEYQIEEGQCVVIELEWQEMRDLVIPIRRILTHGESDELKVLYKPAGGELTTADFPKVQSYTQFSLVSQATWLGALISEQRFTSVLQPIVYAKEPTRVFAREALLRGVSRDEAIVYPNYLFDVARGCGMLVQLDLAARKAAIDRMVMDQMSETLFVNLTPSAIDDPLSSLERTVEMIDVAKIAHDRIVFEVVESEQTTDMHHLRGLLRFYRDAGFRVALDDVGAGYSSLNLLHQLRPDFVKLDMDLIRGVHEDPYKALVAEKTIEIASTLGIQTIAEGIEVPEELAWVQSHGATYAQGFGIARPGVPTLNGRTPPGVDVPWN
ncbi:MAG: EAL domain-containing protein [Gemmatimonadetes bacterium]|nr:EAL domain-containing protein [Gemmatimonadota bacterium]